MKLHTNVAVAWINGTFRLAVVVIPVLIIGPSIKNKFLPLENLSEKNILGNNPTICEKYKYLLHIEKLRLDSFKRNPPLNQTKEKKFQYTIDTSMVIGQMLELERQLNKEACEN